MNKIKLNKAELNQVIQAALSDHPQVARRWASGDPTVVAMLSAIRDMLVAVADDVEQNLLEPFIKSKPATIIADAINKGILPVGSPCQHFVWIKNSGNFAVNLSAGRELSDNFGRQWRLLSSVNLPPQSTQKVPCEQSFMTSQTFRIGATLPFYEYSIEVGNDSHISTINLYHSELGIVPYTPKLMNAAKGELGFSVSSTDFATLKVIFGDSTRVGRTAVAGETYRLDTTYTDGFIEVSELKQAILTELYDENERNLRFYFVNPDDDSEVGLIKQGANPPTLSQLRLTASYPMSYDDNAVFLGNFDMLLRKHYASRCDYLAVWNETIHERHYGASLENINRLNVCVVPKIPAEMDSIKKEIADRIARADNLFLDRVRFMAVRETPIQLTITGNLSGIHDMDEVIAQIKGVLLSNYGKGSIIASRHNQDGFNRFEMAKLIRDSVPAFADRISDFSVILATSNPKPHEWGYLTDSSISIELNRSADNGAGAWGLL